MRYLTNSSMRNIMGYQDKHHGISWDVIVYCFCSQGFLYMLHAVGCWNTHTPDENWAARCGKCHCAHVWTGGVPKVARACTGQYIHQIRTKTCSVVVIVYFYLQKKHAVLNCQFQPWRGPTSFLRTADQNYWHAFADRVLLDTLPERSCGVKFLESFIAPNLNSISVRNNLPCPYLTSLMSGGHCNYLIVDFQMHH